MKLQSLREKNEFTLTTKIPKEWKTKLDKMCKALNAIQSDLVREGLHLLFSKFDRFTKKKTK